MFIVTSAPSVLIFMGDLIDPVSCGRNIFFHNFLKIPRGRSLIRKPEQELTCFLD